MSAAYWAAPLSDEQVDFRLSALVDTLNGWGDVRYADESASASREFRTEVLVSTYDAPGVKLIYAESFRRTGNAWLLFEYQYNFVDRTHTRFFAYHHHPIHAISGSDCITHEHCRPPNNDEHFRGAWVDLYEAHDTFLIWAADPDQYPDCRSKKLLTGFGR